MVENYQLHPLPHQIIFITTAICVFYVVIFFFFSFEEEEEEEFLCSKVCSNFSIFQDNMIITGFKNKRVAYCFSKLQKCLQNIIPTKTQPN